MSIQGVIIGNGTLADDPKQGYGVQHSFRLYEDVVVVKEHADDKGKLIRYICRDSKGKTQLVMPEHFKQG